MWSKHYKVFLLPFLFCIQLSAQTPDTLSEIKEIWDGLLRLEELLVELTPNERLDLIYEAFHDSFKGLYIECSSERKEHGKYHLIISANGNKSYFPLVQTIVDMQPEFEHIEVTAFREPMPGYTGILYEGLNLSVDQMYFTPILTDSGLDMKFFIPNENKGIDQDILFNYGSIVIDFVIGEVTFVEKINAYDFYLMEEAEASEELIPLTKLLEYVTKQ